MKKQVLIENGIITVTFLVETNWQYRPSAWVTMKLNFNTSTFDVDFNNSWFQNEFKKVQKKKYLSVLIYALQNPLQSTVNISETPGIESYAFENDALSVNAYFHGLDTDGEGIYLITQTGEVKYRHIKTAIDRVI